MRRVERAGTRRARAPRLFGGAAEELVVEPASGTLLETRVRGRVGSRTTFVASGVVDSVRTRP